MSIYISDNAVTAITSPPSTSSSTSLVAPTSLESLHLKSPILTRQNLADALNRLRSLAPAQAKTEHIQQFLAAHPALAKDILNTEIREGRTVRDTVTGCLNTQRKPVKAGEAYVQVKWGTIPKKKKSASSSSALEEKATPASSANAGVYLHVIAYYTLGLGVKGVGDTISHLCGNAMCIEPKHLHRESHAVNNSRQRCLVWGYDISHHPPRFAWVCSHEPPCFKRCVEQPNLTMEQIRSQAIPIHFGSLTNSPLQPILSVDNTNNMNSATSTDLSAFTSSSSSFSKRSKLE